MIKILNSNFERQAILKNVINPNRFEELNGENTLTFSAVLDEKASEYINENAVVELDEDYFDVVYLKKSQNQDGTLTIDVETEHVSYRLNNTAYDMDYFASTGTPTEVLADILSGTGFTVGTIEFANNITYSIQEKKSRRQMLVEFVTLLGGELDFDKFKISILQHRGSQGPKLLAKGKNIKIVSKIINKREKDEYGNQLVSYTCEPIMLPEKPLELGDKILLVQKDLGIKEQLRIVRIGYNPYNPVEAEIELANFVSGFEDDIYKLQSTTVAKDKLYYGARIGPEVGFESVRSDKKARACFNADIFTMQAGDGSGSSWEDRLYFDASTGKYKFVGDIIMQGGSISWESVNPPNAEQVGAKPYDWTPEIYDVTGLSNRLTYIDQYGIYTGTLTANQINAINGIQLGANATINWDYINKPTPEQIGAKPYDWTPDIYDVTGLSNRLTYIDDQGIYTGTLTANQINAINGIQLGANATINWDYINKPTAQQIGARPDTWTPTAFDVGAIPATYIDAYGIFTLGVYANTIDTRYGKITTAQIENLVVGTNVTMGPYATISWDNVTNRPTIPTQYTDAMALAAYANTYIDAYGVYTGNVYADKIKGNWIAFDNGSTITDLGLGSLTIASSASINLNTGILYYNSYEVATKNWVNSQNFIDYYTMASYVNSQNFIISDPGVTIAVSDAGIVVTKNGVSHNIFYD